MDAIDYYKKKSCKSKKINNCIFHVKLQRIDMKVYQTDYFLRWKEGLRRLALLRKLQPKTLRHFLRRAVSYCCVPEGNQHLHQFL